MHLFEGVGHRLDRFDHPAELLAHFGHLTDPAVDLVAKPVHFHRAAANGGLATIILGPGDLAVAHSPREAVAVSQVTEAAEIYARAALDFCGGRQ